MNLVKWMIAGTAVVAARLGLIDEARGRRIADIAWPLFMMGLARTSQRTADVIMVGIAIGPAGIAGLGFALAYWGIARSVGFSLANATITFMSQRYGANDFTGVDLSFKQSLWIEIVLASAFTITFIGAAETLIGVLGAGDQALEYGSVYLQVITIGLVFGVGNQLSNALLISVNDAWTPMLLRGGGAVLNIVLNAVFIFGLGLGVFGAALGTVIATVSVSVIFIVGLLRGRLPYFGDLPITVSVTRPYFDLQLTKQILTVATPMMGRQVITRASRFFMLAIVAQFGTIIVAAYVASREIREIMNTPGWGFGTAARTLVGQELGANDEANATAFGWDILRFTTVVYVVVAIFMFIFPNQIAAAFTDDPAATRAIVPFILVMAISLLGLGIDISASGILSAAGDTRWPLYGRFVGLYIFMIPIAYLGIITPLGIIALYIAVTAETVVPALISFIRFTRGKWIDVSRRYRPTPTD